jgi:hypothetical protein
VLSVKNSHRSGKDPDVYGAMSDLHEASIVNSRGSFHQNDERAQSLFITDGAITIPPQVCNKSVELQ